MKQQKYVPLDKQSKRKKKEYYTAQLRDWGEINPVTQKTPNLKVYNRKKIGQQLKYELLSDFFIMLLFLYSNPKEFKPLRYLIISSSLVLSIICVFCLQPHNNF